MADRSNGKLNRRVEQEILKWEGTTHGRILDQMYRGGADYEGICEYAGIPLEESVEESEEME